MAASHRTLLLPRAARARAARLTPTPPPAEEEKLEPVTNIKDDPRIRLLNRLYAKKRQDLQQRRAVTHGEPGSVSQQEKQARAAAPHSRGAGSL